MMANENMEEWGASAWIELEAIASVIEAYGKGEIELPEVPAKTIEKLILDWVDKKGDGTQPDTASETAFEALDAIDSTAPTAARPHPRP